MLHATFGAAACSNDNVSDADSGNGAENKDLTGKTSFSITSEAKTRTSGVYDSGVNFYWTTNDNILGKEWFYTNSK